jgi:hypothetical protein
VGAFGVGEQVRVLGKLREDRFPRPGDEGVLQGDPVQESDDALGDGSDVVQGLVAERHDTERFVPGPVLPLAVVLQEQLAIPDRYDPVQVRSTAVGDDLFEAVGEWLRQWVLPIGGEGARSRTR